MKQPPLIQAMFAVMILGVVNVQMKGSPLAELSVHQWVALAVAVVGAGAVVTPFVTAKREEPQASEAPTRADDDFDLTA